MPIGDRIKALRSAAGLSQHDLAVKAGLQPIHISRLERNKNDPYWSTVCAIADALGISVQELRDLPEEEETEPKKKLKK